MASDRKLDIPLSRLDFLRRVSPPSTASLVDKLREKHWAAPPHQEKPQLRGEDSPSETDVRHILLINELADLTNENLPLCKGLAAATRDTKDMKDLARNFSHSQMSEYVKAEESASQERKTVSTVSDQGKGQVHKGQYDMSGRTPASVLDLQQKLYHRHTNAVIARMVSQGEIVVDRRTGQKPSSSDHQLMATPSSQIGGKQSTEQKTEVAGQVVEFLDEHDDFNIRSQSVMVYLYQSKKTPEAPVVKALKVLQATQALTHTPEALPALTKNGISSAVVAAQLPRKTFVSRLGTSMGSDDLAAAIHEHATTITSRNATALLSLLQEARGTGVAMIDGSQSRMQLTSQAKRVGKAEPERVDLETLFGPMDVCECDDCNSVTSPAAYFVELLQYLRNNNLDPESQFMGPDHKHGIPGIQAHTPLGVLNARRPDIIDLDLTCANTTTVLPYIDLANEVMESFIVHMQKYAESTENPKQAILDVFNADPDGGEGLGASSAELLAKPQNTNDRAYCILSNAVYPSTQLPFNQPVALIRLALEFLGTSRADLGETMIREYTPPDETVIDAPKEKPPPKDGNNPGYPDGDSHGYPSDSDDCCDDSDDGSCSDTPDNSDETDPPKSQKGKPISTKDQKTLVDLHNIALQRAADAERLLLTQEEYIILTKEAFWPKRHFEIRYGQDFSANEYRTKIGVRKDWEYWGVDYASVADMLSANETAAKGLTFVKKQFLPRTGITYADVVDLIRTRFINPKMPQGRDRVIMEAFRLSYAFMKSLVGPGKTKERFCKLVNFIDSTAWEGALKKYGGEDVMELFDEDDGNRCGGCSCCCVGDPCAPPCGGRDGREPQSLEEEKKRCRYCCSYPCRCRRRRRLLRWLCANFTRLGEMIVLESGIAPVQLPWEAKLVVKKPERVPQRPNLIGEDEFVLAELKMDCRIIEWQSNTPANPSGKQIGRVDITGKVYAIVHNPDMGVNEEKEWSTVYPEQQAGQDLPRTTQVLSFADDKIGTIDAQSNLVVDGEEEGRIPWMGLTDDCDISKDRLRHLDSNPVTAEEYDKIHRFLRLWRKLGWTMTEVDTALMVLGVPASQEKPTDPKCPPPSADDPCSPPAEENPPQDEEESDVDWDDFERSCEEDGGENGGCKCDPPKPDCPGSNSKGKPKDDCCCRKRCCDQRCHPKHPKPKNQPQPVISADFLHELVSVKKLADITGLEVLQLLALWGPISITGLPSLYSKLFLTHNLKGIDTVFVADKNGNYLASSPPLKLKDHVPIILAAFQIKIKDWNDILVNSGILPGGSSADLTLETVSRLYRYVLLSRLLQVTPVQIPFIFKTLGFNVAGRRPFESAQATLQLVELWNEINDSGFTFPQISYSLTGTEVNPLNPVGPTKTSILRTTMAIYTGLNDIDTQYPDITTGTADEAAALAKATSAAVLQYAQLIFDSDYSAQVSSFLDGKLVFSASAPSGLIIAIPKEDVGLSSKIKYADGDPAQVQITGQLTENEKTRAMALSANPGWKNAIKRCINQARTLLNSLILSGVFPASEEATAKEKLLAGDVPDSPDGQSPPVPGTGPEKRLYFLKWFIPFLRRKLTDKLVIDAISSATSLDPAIAEALLKDVVKDKSDPAHIISALEALEKIKADSAPGSQGFIGYLVPPATDEYILFAEADNKPPPLLLDGQNISFAANDPDEEPSNLWATPPLTLMGGRLYKIVLSGFPASLFSWKTQRSLRTTIPASTLLADHVTGALMNVFAVVFKCSIIINNFALTLDEVVHVQKFAVNFKGGDANFDWNTFTLLMWERLRNYNKLRDSLPKLEDRLIDLFIWANDVSAKETELVDRIQRVTAWGALDIMALLSKKNFNLQGIKHFRNEIALLKLQKALTISGKVGMPIDSLFNWAKPRINFWQLRDVSNEIRTAIRALYKLSDWEVAIKPTYDKLRKMQSQALTAYLINQPVLREQDVFDADSLFEFLLIDTQMSACMETSRLKQATSTVQLFVQRCFLDLEVKYGITASMLDRDRWEWMSKYRIWEANRKVFLYPENWIQPSLRDDKSPVYMQLESELMQRDLSKTAVTDAMKNFLFKVEEVSNLEVSGIYFEDQITPAEATGGEDDAPPPPKRDPLKFHVFARTRAAPYKYYYRYFTFSTGAWSPWQDLSVDVPRYEIEKPKRVTDVGDGDGPITEKPSLARSGGSYLIPFTFNSRLMLAIPQFAKIQLPAPVPKKTAADIGNNTSTEESEPEEYWEIKMGLSELRNGKWTPKFVSSEAMSGTRPSPKPLPPVGQYQFVVRDTQQRNADLPSILIDCFLLTTDEGTQESPVTNPTLDVTATRIGIFSFTGSHFGVAKSLNPDTPEPRRWTDFQMAMSADGNFRIMRPIQTPRESKNLIHDEDVVVSYPKDDTVRTSTIKYDKRPEEERFYHPFVHTLLERLGATDNLDSVFKYLSLPQASESAWQKTQHLSDKFIPDAYGASQVESKVYNELTRPYALYNWEAGFHAPIAIADRLLQNQQFDLALKMMHYVFDPSSDDSGPVATRVWKWLPFREANPMLNIQKILSSLRPNTADSARGQITQWRDNPFEPHVVARLRPTAYMKFVVMKYISILIAYGDYYFRQNTLETVPMAIQLYVLASHIYGSPGQKIPKRAKKKTQTYRSAIDKWDAFSNAMVQMEIMFPFSINQITEPLGRASGVEGLANIFGFASTGYFCVPDNTELRALRATIDDRLFKIRNCQDINGIERKLPLYEPPIDPGLLVAATAAGLSLSSVLNDLNASTPNFKFKHLLRVALDMCEHLRRLGKAFVMAKEKHDAESLLELKQRQENVIHQKILEEKTLARDEAKKSEESLVQSRKAPEYVMKHNLKLLGEDIGSIPSISDIESEFKEIVDEIEPPVVESGIKLIAAEKEEVEKLVKSLDLKPVLNALETLASEMHILPTLNAHASPFGVGVASCWGFPNIAKGIQGAAKAYSAVTNWLEHQSQNINKIQGFVKQKQHRTKEANTAGHEIKHIDQQIVTQQIRVATHEAAIAAQDQAIEHSREVHDFLTSKYTAVELYTWTEQQLSNLYYQSYTATYDVAKKAEMAFRYERGIVDSAPDSPPPFIRFGYWEPRNDGLLSGERLWCSLKELEAAYHEARGHDFEITKHVSLRSVNPIALIALRGLAVAEFAIPEVLFDMDFPGHYSRRIKSVALTLKMQPSPGADGSESSDPYAQANCTLRLTANKFRISPFVRGRSDYAEKTDADDPRFTAVSHVPVSAIAASSPSFDAGVFEVNFDGDRLLPFEGAGAISAWRLEFHNAFRTVDLANVQDVILHMSYTARDGGRALGDAASAAVVDYVRSVRDTGSADGGGGLFAVLDVPRDFPEAWTEARGQGAARVLHLIGLKSKLPVYTKGIAADRLKTQDVYIATDSALPPGDVSVRQGGTVMAFTKADGVVGQGTNAMSALHSTDGPVTMKDWDVTVGEGIANVKDMLILVRYTMG